MLERKDTILQTIAHHVDPFQDLADISKYLEFVDDDDSAGINAYARVHNFKHAVRGAVAGVVVAAVVEALGNDLNNQEIFKLAFQVAAVDVIQYMVRRWISTF